MLSSSRPRDVTAIGSAGLELVVRLPSGEKMNSAFRFVVTAIAFAAPAALAAQQQGRMAYPPTKTINHVDDYFGRKVADPYRWMEDLNASDVAQWVKAENAVTEKFLATLPMRERFRSRITELWNYPKVGLPFREAGKLFYTKNSGLQRQSAYYMRATLGAPEQLVIDPNVLSPDGSVALTLFTPSP